jgi:hypothetical protein
VLANRAHDKSRYITRLLLETEVQWAMLRLLFDLKGISEGEFKVLSARLSDIGKQSQAWLKWEQGAIRILYDPARWCNENFS